MFYSRIEVSAPKGDGSWGGSFDVIALGETPQEAAQKAYEYCVTCDKAALFRQSKSIVDKAVENFNQGESYTYGNIYADFGGVRFWTPKPVDAIECDSYFSRIVSKSDWV